MVTVSLISDALAQISVAVITNGSSTRVSFTIILKESMAVPQAGVVLLVAVAFTVKVPASVGVPLIVTGVAVRVELVTPAGIPVMASVLLA